MEEPITFAFSGFVDRVADENDVLGGSIIVGTVFTGTYTFDPTVIDINEDNPDQAAYDNAILDVRGAILSLSGEMPFGGPARDIPGVADSGIVVANDYGMDVLDRYGLVTRVTLLDDSMDFVIDYFGNNTVFDSDAMLLAPPPLDQAVRTQVIFIDQSMRMAISGHLTDFYLVPEPAALLLLFLGGLFVLGRRGG